MKHAKLILAVLGLALIFASLCSADPMIYRGRYYSNSNPVIDSLSPWWVGGEPNPLVWDMTTYHLITPQGGAPETPEVSSLPPSLGTNATMAFAMENRTRSANIKSVTLYIEYTGGPLVVTRYGSGIHGVPDIIGQEGAYITGSGGKLYMNWPIVPQPDWEYILIKNTGSPVAFTKVHFYSDCMPIPSLTEWGMIGLGVLILGAGAMVIVRRRRIAVGA